MKRLALIPVVLLAAACATSQPGASRTSALPGHGAITLQIVPNPIVATRVAGNTYDFAFDAILHETGGRAVFINRVTAEVYALGAIKVASESFDGDRIRSLGYSTNLPGNGELRYHFALRKDVGDDRLFSSVYGDVRVEASDDTGTPTTATTRVTVKR